MKNPCSEEAGIISELTSAVFTVIFFSKIRLENVQNSKGNRFAYKRYFFNIE